MKLHSVLGSARQAAAAIAIALLASPAVAANDWVNGDAQYHSSTLCVNCHNPDPTMSRTVGTMFYPAPAPYGATASNLQGEINGSMGSPYTDGLHTANAATIHNTISDISAYLGNLDYPTATITSTGHDFGSVPTNATATTTFRVTNNGRGPLHVSGATISDTVNFSVDASNCSAAVPAGGSFCTISVTFKPQSAATFIGRTVTVSHDALNGSTPVSAFRGVGTTPVAGFNVAPATLTLSAKVNSPANGSVTISNPAAATANLVLGTLTYSSTRYVRNPASTCNTGTSLAPGGSCLLTTTFTPNAAGAQNGTLTIAHNAPGGSATVTLNGTGTQPSIDPTAASLPFDNVQLGVPKVLTLVVTNTGNASLVFAAEPSASRTGPARDDYAVGGTCQVAAPLAPGDTCTLIVTFTPTAIGLRPATLTVTSDAGNGALVVALSGTGVALPEPVVAFPVTDFPDTVIGENSAVTRTITIRNDRTRDIGYTVTAATDFTIASETCPTHVVVGGGTTCSIAVRFAPALGAGEGRRQGTMALTFTGTGGDGAPSNASGIVAGLALLPLNPSARTLNAAAVVGTPATVSLLLTNRSATSLVLSTFAFGGATPADYSRDPSSSCTAGATLGASASCTFVIRFAPGAAGTRNATLTISHTALGSPAVVLLNGTATPAPQGRIEIGAASIAFAETQLGTSSSRSVTVANTGDLALTFSAFTIGGAAAADFARSGDCAVAAPLAIGASCTLTVAFAPSALGARSGTLTIASIASNGTAVLALAGAGVPVPAPQATLTPGTLDFGNQTTGGLYPTRQVHLANSGTADLAIAGIAVTGSGFTAVGTACPAVLAPSAGCDIAIAFLATAATAYNGALTVTSNAAGSPHVVALKGAGVASALPVLVWAPAVASLDFGNVSAGSLSAVQTVTLQNQGPGGVTLTVLNAIGTGAASFSVVGGTCAIAAPLFQGDSCTIGVRFAPGSAGAKTASVQIASTGSFPPVLALSGTGLAGPNPSLELSAAGLDFGSTRVGAQSLPSTVRLTSSGTGVVTVSAMEVTGTYAIQSTTCPALPFTLPAGTDCTVAVSFAPTGDGAAAGMLRVTSDAAPAVREVALKGSGDKAADVSGGGCTVTGRTSAVDPMLWLLLLAAIGVLARRRLRKGSAA